MKEHAKAYLKEFASSQPNWIKALIYGTIETNGNISNSFFLPFQPNFSQVFVILIFYILFMFLSI